MNPSLWRPRRQDVWANLWSRPRCLEMWALTICRAGGGLWGIPGMPMSRSVQVEFDLGWFLGKCYGMVQAFFFQNNKELFLKHQQHNTSLWYLLIIPDVVFSRQFNSAGWWVATRTPCGPSALLKRWWMTCYGCRCFSWCRRICRRVEPWRRCPVAAGVGMFTICAHVYWVPLLHS